MNAGNVEPSIVGSGLRTRSTPGAAPFGILSANPADTNFALGWLRSKLIVTCVAVVSIDEITPVAWRARMNEFPLDSPSWPGGCTSWPPKRHDAPIISWMNAPLGCAVATTSIAASTGVAASATQTLIRLLIVTLPNICSSLPRRSPAGRRAPQSLPGGGDHPTGRATRTWLAPRIFPQGQDKVKYESIQSNVL